MRSNKSLFMLSVVVITGVLLSACATTVTPTTAPTPAAAVETSAPTAETAVPTLAPTEAGILPEVDPSTITGDIISAGSSTVYPLSEAIEKLFEKKAIRVNIRFLLLVVEQVLNVSVSLVKQISPMPAAQSKIQKSKLVRRLIEPPLNSVSVLTPSPLLSVKKTPS